MIGILIICCSLSVLLVFSTNRKDDIHKLLSKIGGGSCINATLFSTQWKKKRFLEKIW